MKSIKIYLNYFALIITMISFLLVTCVKVDLKPIINVSTGEISNISYTRCTVSGAIISIGEGIKQHGFCWSLSSNPSINDNKVELGAKSATGIFSAELSNLAQNTTYYLKAYATGNNGTIYGETKSFETPPNILGTISTIEITNITETSARCGVNIADDGGAQITARGVCWSTSQNPTVSNSKTTNGSGMGSYTSELTNLSCGTTYYVRAYATNSVGTAYGNQVSFTTKECKTPPIVSTRSVYDITYNSARSGGNVTNDGNAPVTSRGVCWSTSQYPTTANPHTIDGSGVGSYTSSLSNLSSSSKYYVRAYATNSIGTGYGNQLEFNTLPNPVGLIAIIYKDNSTDANSFKNLLLDYGASVNLIEIDNVASIDFSNYNLIIIASNTSFGNVWGTTQAVNNIKNSGKLVLGLGFGGAGFFQEYGLSINWGNSWYGSNSTSDHNTSIFCAYTTHQVFKNPTNITIPSNKILQLYSESGHVGEYAPALNQGVLLIGREPTNTTHYTIVSENNHWLWGFSNSPNYMTQTGKNLFLNIVSYMLE